MLEASENRKVTRIAGRLSQDFDLERLRKIQEKIAARVVIEDRVRKPTKRVAGFDVAYFDDEAIAASVTMDYERIQVIEEKTMKAKVSFPYISTFLGFREGPLIIRLARNLKIEPDVLLINSQGIAHPLFCGCASHVGVSVGKPTIGVAGTRLCGEYKDRPERVGDWAPLKYRERIVGAVLLSQQGSEPIFISVGHMIRLETAIKIVKHFTTIYRFPEPVRLAHELANKTRRKALI